MLRVAGAIVAVAFYIYCIIDVLRTRSGETRTLPKSVWLIVVIAIPLIGGALWLLFGRVWNLPGSRRRRRGPVAPDDDPSFLKKIGDDAWSQRMRQRRGGGASPAPDA